MYSVYVNTGRRCLAGRLADHHDYVNKLCHVQNGAVRLKAQSSRLELDRNRSFRYFQRIIRYPQCPSYTP